MPSFPVALCVVLLFLSGAVSACAILRLWWRVTIYSEKNRASILRWALQHWGHEWNQVATEPRDPYHCALCGALVTAKPQDDRANDFGGP